jgi:hypothetical protein
VDIGIICEMHMFYRNMIVSIICVGVL